MYNVSLLRLDFLCMNLSWNFHLFIIPPPRKITKKYRVSKQYWLNSLKNHSYQASIQCWANIDTPAKRHLNGVLLAGWCWPANGLLIVVFGSSLPSSTEKKNVVKVRPPLTKLWIGACMLKYAFLKKLFHTWSHVTLKFRFSSLYIYICLQTWYFSPHSIVICFILEVIVHTWCCFVFILLKCYYNWNSYLIL